MKHHRNHHRVDASALFFLILLSGFFIYRELTHRNADLSGEVVVAVPLGGISPSEITHGDTSKNQVIFTFDGGDGSQSAQAILEILKKHNVKGTFFLTGKFVLGNANLVRQIFNEGHEIFNHTFDHPYLTKIGNEEIIDELVATNDTLVALLGTSTKPYFRPPYGDRNANVLKVAAEAGYRSVYWTIDAHDWMESTGTTADEVRERILSNIRPGTIFLMHLGDTLTGSVLDDVFTSIESRGYRIVSLTEGL